MKIQDVSPYAIVRSVDGIVYCVRGRVVGSNRISVWVVSDLEIPISGIARCVLPDVEVQQIASHIYKEPEGVCSPINWNGPRRRNRKGIHN